MAKSGMKNLIFKNLKLKSGQHVHGNSTHKTGNPARQQQ
jgi:hypothetical protein